MNNSNQTKLIKKDYGNVLLVTAITGLGYNMAPHFGMYQIYNYLKHHNIACDLYDRDLEFFKKTDFDKFSKDKNVVIKKVRLENRNDDNVLKQELINQIYAFSEKKVIVVADIEFSENFLIYIDKIENVSIGEKMGNYKKYFDLSKNKITTDLYNTYNSYLENKYEININYQTLAKTKNYF